MPSNTSSSLQNLNNLLEVTLKANVTTKSGLVYVGRCLCRGASLFDDPNAMIVEARRRNRLQPTQEDQPRANTLEQNRLYHGYVQATKAIPQFKGMIDTLTDTATSLLFHHDVQIGYQEARSDDVYLMKSFIAEFLNEEMRKAAEKQPPSEDPANKIVFLNTRHRENRGIGHKVTGRLLCPISLNWDDESIRTLIQELDPAYHPSNSLFSRCFYENYEGDPAHLYTGFLKSPILVRAYTRLYLGITNLESTLELPKAEPNTPTINVHKDSLSKKLHLDRTVTPRTIAYTAVMVHLNLQNFVKWNPPTRDGYCYQMLYNSIVDFFEQPVGPRAKTRIKNLLEWWTLHVYGPKLPTLQSLQTSADNFLQQLEDLENEE